MDLNNAIKGKAVPLGIIMIIISYLTSGASSSIVPYILFAGILIGIMRNDDMTESAVASGIATLVAAVLISIFSFAVTYMSYGAVYANYMISSLTIYIIIYLVVGIVGGVLGYFISKEIGLWKTATSLYYYFFNNRLDLLFDKILLLK